jgi:uncharacterized membrane protein
MFLALYTLTNDRIHYPRLRDWMVVGSVFLVLGLVLRFTKKNKSKFWNDFKIILILGSCAFLLALSAFCLLL